MSFLGTEFIFDGTSSYEYGLCLYSRIDNASQDSTSWASNVKMFEDRPYRRYRSYCYGGSVQDSLEFKLVFGVSEDRKATFGEYDHWEMQKIASWLTGHRDYRWLEIVQDDLSRVRYHCYIDSLEAVEDAIGDSHVKLLAILRMDIWLRRNFLMRSMGRQRLLCIVSVPAMTRTPLLCKSSRAVGRISRSRT